MAVPTPDGPIQRTATAALTSPLHLTEHSAKPART